MPTPSEPERNSEFGLGTPPPRRSVFGNYRPEAEPSPAVPSANGGGRPAARPEQSASEGAVGCGAQPSAIQPTLQCQIDTALARSFLCRFLAKAFEDPDPAGWRWLTDERTRAAVDAVATTLAGNGGLRTAAETLLRHLDPGDFDSFHRDHVICFGHTVRGDCPMNEIEYGDLKADPLFQPHRLADLGAFYTAFGLELAPDAAERQDHISIELEFLSVLAAREAYALEHQFDEEPIAIGREAQKAFLREHLGRWSPAFTRRLGRMAGDTALGALAGFTREFILAECARLGVPPGSEDLLLRPIDESASTLCASCGINNLPPGAIRSPVENS
ncbi:MAG TPA: molecular chaperone TorD family protein [Methylomirabilota bacterium]|nr:molecular chaperone TorD family protein [Methylomirabilota bacterium]